MSLPARPLGRTGINVSVFGLGGEGVLRTHGQEEAAGRVIRAALDEGVTYFESARAYAGSEGYLGRWLGTDRQHITLATKSHQRTAAGAQTHLEQSLDLLRTEWLDVWYVHDLRTPDDLQAIAAPGGALEAFDRAKLAGTVRWVGATGHENPGILAEALSLYPFDCVLMPVNPAEAFPGGFLEGVVPDAVARGMGVVAMKTLCRGLALQVPGASDPAAHLRYAATTPGVSLLSVGCDTPDQVRQNVRSLGAALPADPVGRERLEQTCYPHAAQLHYYR